LKRSRNGRFSFFDRTQITSIRRQYCFEAAAPEQLWDPGVGDGRGLRLHPAAIATLRSQNREFPTMSEAHPDADLVKVTRTTTTYEPAPKASEPPAVKRRNPILLWALGACLVVAVIAAGWFFYNAQTTPAAAQQNAVAANQGLAQTLTQKASTAQQQAQTAQQSADQSETNARSLAASAANDRTAANRAADNARASRAN
jgi:hypothetical protein